MSSIKILFTRRYAALCIAVIIGIAAYASSTEIARAQACTTQIAGLTAADFGTGISFTINYQNGPAFDRPVNYTGNTAPSNPPKVGEGIIEPAPPPAAGNLAAITFQGVRLEYNAGAQTFILPTTGRQVWARAYSYQGNQYAEIIPQAPAGNAQPCTTQIAGLTPADIGSGISFTIHYQNGNYDPPVYTGNTTVNPPGIDGDIVRGPNDFGNLTAITYRGVRLEYNNPSVIFILPTTGRQIWVRARSYQGNQYAEFIPQPPEGDAEPCTTQIGGLTAADIGEGISFTINYQNGSYTPPAYTDNTAPNPPGIQGHIVRGPDDYGNLQSVTIQGQILLYDAPAQEVTLPSGGHVRARTYRYGGHAYVEILPSPLH